MKKTYIPLLGILLAALAALLFVLLPVTTNLVIAYIFWLIGIVFLIVSVYALGAKEKSLIMELPLFLKARGYLLMTAIISAIVLLLENVGVFSLPFVLHLVAQVVALLLFGLQVTKLNLGKAHIKQIEAEVAKARNALGALVSDLNALKGKAKVSPEVEKALTDVADALRFSDPISTEAVIELDGKIATSVESLGTAISAGQANEALKHTEVLLTTIRERNERNKKSKRDADAPRRLEQEKITAEKHRVMNKKLAKILTAIAVVVIAAALFITQVIIPRNKYDKATAYLTNRQYDEAIAAFLELGAYSDSAVQAQRAAAINRNDQQKYKMATGLLVNMQYEEAVAMFTELGAYLDSDVKVKEANIAHQDDKRKYDSATDLLKSRKFDEATALFAELGNFSDSAVMLKEVSYQKGKSLITDRKYDEATVVFLELGTYSDSKTQVSRIASAFQNDQQKYKTASELFGNKQFDEAAALFGELGSYLDSVVKLQETNSAHQSDKQKYDSAINLMKSSKIDEAIALFAELGAFSDSAVMLKETTYQKGKALLASRQYDEANAIFNDLGSYFDSSVMMQESAYLKGADLLASQRFEEAAIAFTKLGDYADSAERATEAAAADQRAKQNYNWATDLLASHQYDEAIALFTELGTYSDSAIKLQESTYQMGKALLESKQFDKAAELFMGLGAYADSEVMAKECAYQKGKALLFNGQYDEAAIVFRKLGSFSNSVAMVHEVSYLKARQYLNNKNFDEASVLFAELDKYSDSEIMLKETMYLKARDLLSNKMYEKAIALFTALGNYSESAMMLRETIYQKGMALVEAGSYSEAYATFKGIIDYRDTASIISGNQDLAAAAVFAAAELDRIYNVGRTITFGIYEQDNNLSNGQEPIHWRVLKRDGTKALLISTHNLDVQQYHTDRESVTWETCSLRQWLNSSFMITAFAQTEQEAIVKVTLENKNNSEYGTLGGSATYDHVFVFSIDEANLYFAGDADRVAVDTEYASSQGTQIPNNEDDWWWLRSPGSNSRGAACVNNVGTLNLQGVGVYFDSVAVRPALWIDLSSF